MNAARRLRTRLGLAAMVAMALGVLTMAANGISAQEDDDWWVGWAYFDEVSKCEDRCRLGPEEDTCRCYRMPPIVIKAPPKD